MHAGSGPRPAATCARGSTASWPRRTRRRGRSGAATSRCCARWHSPTLPSRRRTGAGPPTSWPAPMTLAQARQARPPAHRAAGTARLGARPLRREVAVAVARGRRRRRHLRAAARLRRRPPRARRLGAPGAARRRRAAVPFGPGPLAAPLATGAPAPARSTPNMVLTPKEREVLELLDAPSLQQGDRA